jgi:hypothetical protein
MKLRVASDTHRKHARPPSVTGLEVQFTEPVTFYRAAEMYHLKTQENTRVPDRGKCLLPQRTSHQVQYVSMGVPFGARRMSKWYSTSCHMFSSMGITEATEPLICA